MISLLAHYLLLSGCILLGVWLVVAAWRRPNPRRRLLRVLASALVPLGLWFSAYPPTRAVPTTQSAAILLTEGYQPDSLRQLQRRLGMGTPVWSYGVPAPAGTRPLGSLLSLAEQRPALRQLHVLGYGLPAADLGALGNVPLQAHGAPAIEGFRQAHWNPQLRLGQTLVVEGAVAPSKAVAWVSLRAVGTGRDSVRLTKSGTFRLRYLPKVAGRQLPKLVLRQAGRVVATEPVPIEVTTTEQPPVLLLAAVPSFEFKFLKNNLAAQGRAVGLRSTVSKGLVQTEFLNQPAQALDHLTPALLNRYAVVVADAATLAALPPTESQALRAATQAGRLGLVVLADVAPLPTAAPARADFSIVAQPTTGPSANPQPVTWPGGPAGLRTTLPAHLRPMATLKPLVSGPNAALVAASRRYGLGTMVVSVVPNTFRWALQGQETAYGAFWSQLLGAATPPPALAATWQLSNRWPRPHQPLTLRLSGAMPAPTALPTVHPLAGGAAVQLALGQDTRLPEWSAAQFWPSAAGWHQVQGPGRTAYNFFVYDSAAWRGPELAERQQALARHLGDFKAGSNAPGAVQEPWPTGWFFGLLLLAAGFLWLEEKL
ncbi:hypothetical protein FNT36_06875 [Hymenobacter setariae]|uniref:Aerotolerance regulator N-terminal domain-containing protein n=1 Tax=Hymenobacter setariae TaxID=2594794 RepID=A0A558BXC8_9BACT|nr:hypothetical protein [Hymenobacter setariae]TVT41178.1 hypothetical protein FNT36_06875 [Hymenobacter setariae]